ncbi:YqaJ viral recombinase family protein [Jeotgalibaca porci]|uniref:YqaJ viral recombinase family nuclease n=1 Tax=Jeotgalibaca porci TaxID=1868793 RepID=UPI0035A1079B
MGYRLTKTDEDWHLFRSEGLGGSDIGTVLGFNNFKSPYQLWLEKTGQLEPEDISHKVAIQVGNELEDLVARIFTQETGIRVQKDNKSYFKDDKPFLHANIDRKIIGENALLECKTTGAHNKAQWEGENVPASYLLQVQHYLNVLDYEYAYIAVIIGNFDFQYKRIERDQELIDLVEERATKFWLENVKQGIPPEIDGSQSTKESLDQLYSPSYVNKVPMDKIMIQTAEELARIKSTIKDLNMVKTEKENKIKLYMGQHEAEEITSETINANWKTQVSKRFDTKRFKSEHPEIAANYMNETTTKVLRLKEVKEAQ